MKKLNIKKYKDFFQIFLWKSLPHMISYKVQRDEFRSFYKPTMANDFPSTNLKRFLRWI